MAEDAKYSGVFDYCAAFSIPCIILPVKCDPLLLEMVEGMPQVGKICCRNPLATDIAEAFGPGMKWRVYVLLRPGCLGSLCLGTQAQYHSGCHCS